MRFELLSYGEESLCSISVIAYLPGTFIISFFTVFIILLLLSSGGLRSRGLRLLARFVRR